MTIKVDYDKRHIPFYIECRTCKGEDGIYYVIPDEKTLTYISDEYIRNNVRESASVAGKEYLNKDTDEFVY
jgi:hypothetical protein